jgi:hypothetical protein
MTVNKYLMPALVILALFGTIGIAQATGAWVSTGQELVEGKNLTADDVRGWMTIQEVADGLHLPVVTIYELAGVPEGSDVTPDTPLKQLEDSVPGFDVSALRDAIKAYQASGKVAAPAAGTNAESAAGSAGQAPPASVTTQPAVADKQVEPAVPTALAPGAAEKPAAPTAQPAPDPASSSGSAVPAAACEIKGTMTLAEVAEQCRVPLDRLMEAAKLPATTASDTQLKSLKDTIPGFEVQVIRDALAGLGK